MVGKSTELQPIFYLNLIHLCVCRPEVALLHIWLWNSKVRSLSK